MARLKAAGKLPDLGTDAADAAQRMLQADPLADTQVVQLSAIGAERLFVTDLVNSVTEVYRQQLDAAFRDGAASTRADVGDEARKLHEQVLAKQREVDAFRDRYDIVSLDRKENEVLGRMDGLNRSYADSTEGGGKGAGPVGGAAQRPWRRESPYPGPRTRWPWLKSKNSFPT